MTYCVGWKTSKSVFIVADTGITSAHSAFKGHPSGVEPLPSSLGEHVENVSGGVTEEGMYKVFNTEDKILLGFSGEIKLGFELRRQITAQLATGRSCEQSIKNAIATITPLKNISDLSVITGFMIDDRPVLLCFNINGDEKISKDNDIVQIGSASKMLNNVMLKVIRHWSKCNIQDSAHLAYVSSYLQHYSVHNYMPSIDAAGVFWGQRINKEGITQQDDILYALYANNNGKMDHLDIIKVFFRKKYLLIFSTLADTYKCIAVVDNFSKEEFEKDMESLYQALKDENKFNYYSFLSKNQRIITVVVTKNNPSNKFFTFESFEKLTFSNMSHEFLSKILVTLNPSKGGEGILFNVLVDPN